MLKKNTKKVLHIVPPHPIYIWHATGNTTIFLWPNL